MGVGAGDLTTGNYNIDISNEGFDGESGTIRMGDSNQSATFITGIFGADAAGGDAVFITSDGKLGTVNPPSSARFKEEIKPMDKASEAIFALKPVTFRYKKELDSKGIPQFGLVAEEVEKVTPDLVKRDRDGKLQTVRYDAVNAMVEEQERTVQAQEATIAQLKKDFQASAARQQEEIKALTTSLKEQASQIQKVSAQLVLGTSAPRSADSQP